MEIKTIRELKDDFAKEKGYDGWYDYYNYCKSNGFNESEVGYNDLICFCAKYHVNLALQSVVENAKVSVHTESWGDYETSYNVNKKSILDAYPLNNIQ